jgi:hypothetical protein
LAALDKWTDSLNEGAPVDVVYQDFAKDVLKLPLVWSQWVQLAIFTGVTVCSFLDDSVQVYSASRRGHLCVWECNQNTTDLVPKKLGTKKGGSEKEEEDGSAMEEKGERIEQSIHLESVSLYQRKTYL